MQEYLNELNNWFNRLNRISHQDSLGRSVIRNPIIREQVELMLLPVSQEQERVIVAMGFDPYAQECKD
jgi:hypothetical protein